MLLHFWRGIGQSADSMGHILVIDDDAAVRSLTAEALRQVGHRVSEATDGKDGLARFRADGADLVITDLVMPVKEGIETIMELHREFPDTKVIAMSGALHSHDYLQLAGKLGALRTLSKPFTIDRLLSAVENALGASSLRSVE
jgi:DNA-binding NtrC family response regulator